MRNRRGEQVAADADAVAGVPEAMAAVGLEREPEPAGELLLLSQALADLVTVSAGGAAPQGGGRKQPLIAAVSVFAIAAVAAVAAAAGVETHGARSDRTDGQTTPAPEPSRATAYAARSSPPDIPVTIGPMAPASNSPAAVASGDSTASPPLNQPISTLPAGVPTTQPAPQAIVEVSVDPSPKQPDLFTVEVFKLTPGQQYSVSAENESLYNGVAGPDGTMSGTVYIPVGCEGHPAIEDFYVYPEGSPESIGHLQPDLAELLEVAGEAVDGIVCSALDVIGLGGGN